MDAAPQSPQVQSFTAARCGQASRSTTLGFTFCGTWLGPTQKTQETTCSGVVDAPGKNTRQRTGCVLLVLKKTASHSSVLASICYDSNGTMKIAIVSLQSSQTEPANTSKPLQQKKPGLYLFFSTQFFGFLQKHELDSADASKKCHGGHCSRTGGVLNLPNTAQDKKQNH